MDILVGRTQCVRKGNSMRIVSEMNPADNLSLSGAVCDLFCRTLSNGTKIPCGGWTVSERAQSDGGRSIDGALCAGYRHLVVGPGGTRDQEVGRVLMRWLQTHRVRREDIFITVMVDVAAGAARGSAHSRLQQRLTAMTCDAADMLVLQNPDRGQALEPNTRKCQQVQTAWKTLTKLEEDGLCRCKGVSEFGVDDIKIITETNNAKPDVIWVAREPNAKVDERLSLYSFKHNTPLIIDCDFSLGSSIKSIDLSNKSLHKIAKSHNITYQQVVLKYYMQRGLLLSVSSSEVKDCSKFFHILDFFLSDEDIRVLQGSGL